MHLSAPLVAKMFFRASIALPEAFHRLKRQELSEVTQLSPAESAFSCAGCDPAMDVPHALTAFCPHQRFSAAFPPLFPFLLRSRIVPAATDTPHAPSSASRLSRPRLSCPPFSFRAHFLLPLSCRRASFPEFSQTRRREDRSPVSSFSRHGLCIPPFPPGIS